MNIIVTKLLPELETWLMVHGVVSVAVRDLLHELCL